MNVDAERRRRETRICLAKTMRRPREVANERGDRKSFHAEHWNWRKYVKGWTRLETDVFAMKSMRPLAAATAQIRLLKAREEDILNWLSSVGAERS